MDEISIGLESSTTFQMVKALQHSVHILQGTALISLLQPTPETYELFDDIILLSDGQIVLMLSHVSNTVSIASLLAGASDNTGSGIARRIVLKTGIRVILACNIPKEKPHALGLLNAEKRLVQKLIEIGYAKPKSKELSS
ncbi:hypothetical protein DCAR_0726883 [Daucus carota subsp. sativus]|uniref:Uncharacterized protein n=1 Tax=Daucus carota subsp. sativus TaxID=79200 RepID=A0AAF0XGD7_DAUCS|nr:hypothetical protein DCAR_0726883 [Daucus carota subsp. sativus]